MPTPWYQCLLRCIISWILLSLSPQGEKGHFLSAPTLSSYCLPRLSSTKQDQRGSACMDLPLSPSQHSGYRFPPDRASSLSFLPCVQKGPMLGLLLCCCPLEIPNHFVLGFFFWLHRTAFGILVPHQGLNPRPLQWKLGVLTTGPPGKSQSFLNKGPTFSFCSGAHR